LITGSLLLLSFSALAEEAATATNASTEGKKEIEKTVSTSGEQSQAVKFQLFGGYEFTSIKTEDDRKDLYQVRSEDFQSLHGFTFGPGIEFKVHDLLSTTTLPSFTYGTRSKDFGNTEGDKKDEDNLNDNNLKYYAFKIAQSLNFDLDLNSFVLQPVVQVGVGYSIFKRNDKTGAVESSHSIKGLMYDLGAGVNFKLKNGLIPFVHAAYRINRADKVEDKDAEGTTLTKNDIKEDVSNKTTSVSVGLGYQF
ncbi:MAG: porin family protein, partial [Oligoflexia bacterium]|nr:porin family protein [Oligoflexia bacterium]